MNLINASITFLFGLLMTPFKHTPPLAALSFISILTGAGMGLIFKKATNQEAISSARKRMQGHLIEIRLFSADPGFVIRSAMRIIKENAVYLRYVLPAMLVMIIPVAIILIQASGYFSQAPAKPGEQIVVTAKLAGKYDSGTSGNISLEVPAGVNVETPVMYSAALNEASWRISGKPGVHDLSLIYKGIKVRKKFAVGAGIEQSWPVVTTGVISQAILNPGEPPLTKSGSGIREITVNYPERSLSIGGHSVNWLIFYFVFSIIAGLLLKPVLKVEM